VIFDFISLVVWGCFVVVGEVYGVFSLFRIFLFCFLPLALGDITLGFKT